MIYLSFYKATYEYLLQKAAAHGVSEIELQKYFAPNTGNGNLFNYYKDAPMKNLFYRFAYHAQDGNQINNVIKFPIGNDIEAANRRKSFDKLLCGFDHSKFLKQYKSVDCFFDEFISVMKMNRLSKQSITGQYTRGIPYRYCKSVFSAAQFLSQFKDENELKNKLLSLGNMSPIFLSFEIYGFAIPLSCDFIKELDWVSFDLPKPDVHIVKLLYELNFIEKDTGPEASYQAIKKMNQIVLEIQKYDNTITAYKLDKILWLICSETFYLHDNKKNTGSQKRSNYLSYIKTSIEKEITP